MSADLKLEDGVLGLGREGLRTLRRALERDVGEVAAPALQEAGFAAGGEVYDAFRRWLREYARLDDPADLHAALLTEVLSGFFAAFGWGTVTVERVGATGLVIASEDWAEGEPGAGADVPSCFVSTGLLAAFLGRIADADIAVMELDCRSRGDARCRFLAGAPAVLQEVYEAMNTGGTWRDVLG